LVLDAFSLHSEGQAYDDSLEVRILVYREHDNPWGPLPGGSTAEPGVMQHSVWQQQPGTKLCMQILVNSGEVREEEGLQGVFKRLRRNGHQLEKDAANSSAQTVTQKEAEPQKHSPCGEVRALH
jgi:hypothetical protein